MPLQAWYRDDIEGKNWEPHHTNPPEYLDNEELYKKTGVRLEKIEDSICQDPEALERFPSERKYKFHDYMQIDRKSLPNYDEMIKMFYAEHLHDDPEIRLILGGGGYFEVRSIDDRWVRIYVQKGDLLDLPPGIWHRLALDHQNYAHMLRLYKEEPVWRAEFREKTEKPPARDRYTSFMATVA